MEKALIIIDYVNDFIADDGRLSCGKAGQDIQSKIVNVVHQFSNEKQCIVNACDCHEYDDLYNLEKDMFPLHCFDKQGRALYGEVKSAFEALDSTQVLHIDKHRYSAFYGTSLDLKLKERGIKEVYLVGVCSDICILHTAIDAYNLGYKINIYESGIASFNAQGHAFTLAHCEQVLNATILK